MNEFDSSDEDSQTFDSSPFHIDWLNHGDMTNIVGLCALPGCKFKDTWRRLESDIEELQAQEIKDVFLLCTLGELRKYRVSKLIEYYTKAKISVHHYPFSDGDVPEETALKQMIEEIILCVDKKKRCIIHCYGGYGRTGLVAACALLHMDNSLDAEKAIEIIRNLRGVRAIQSVKQYNYINDFISTTGSNG